MNKSLKDIIVLYKDCSELIDKKADDKISYLDLLKSNVGILGKFVNDCKVLLDYLPSAKAEDTPKWNVLIDNSVKELKIYMALLYFDKLQKITTSNENEIKLTLSYLLSFERNYPKIVELSKKLLTELNEIEKNNWSIGKFWFFGNFSEAKIALKNLMYTQDDVLKINKAIESLKTQYIEAYKELQTSKDKEQYNNETMKQVDSLLGTSIKDQQSAKDQQTINPSTK